MTRTQEIQETNQTYGKKFSAESSRGGTYCYETARIWEEAGFTPPPVCQAVVEILHLQSMEERPDRDVFPPHARDVLLHTENTGKECVITDPAHLRKVAREWGVPVAGMSDQEVADLMTLQIIADYCIQP
ncbi:hypothetical protein [uncultured Methanofollis sp.]|uniref:hypothetical protein n=1 Tax=uncultured Methanofollis sp. TaxID=262500 RepID=UPI0026242B81|nr:hypothetical protein [uncultured Methanofollis sp.]